MKQDDGERVPIMSEIDYPKSRRDFLRSGAIAASATALSTFATSAIGEPYSQPAGIRAYRLFAGSDGNSHVMRGTVKQDIAVGAQSIEFKETPAHGSFDWHNDPAPQFVITLTGVLEFTTRTGETFTIHPGDVLIAEDHPGTGHKWRLVDDAPWRRAYIIFKSGVDPRFVPENTSGH